MALKISSGIDSFILHKEAYKHLNIAFVTNDAATTSSGILSRLALLKNQFKLVKIFSPEHGISVKGYDGVKQENLNDAVTNLPAISLYGEKLRPAEEDMLDIDMVLFDIPDIGCRFYTYLWTMTYVMESCAAFNIPFIVLDRPNPIGAILEMSEGPMLDEINCSSFIGRWNIPLKHSCTLGELALCFAATRIPALQIEVIKVNNYCRYQTAENDFPFIPTSPAIQNIQTALLYPGTGLLEGIQINEGRGSNYPFRQFGAPWVRDVELSDFLKSVLKNVRVTPVQYTPASGVFANELCKGVSLFIKNPTSFQAVFTGITILQTLIQLYPKEIKERLYITQANPCGEKHLDKLLGCENAFNLLKQKILMNTDVKGSWPQIMKPFLLYK
ncbi:MAG: exo-beta-N-acetylmuramidase NamZ family protein [Chitinophagaceae bacterium]